MNQIHDQLEKAYRAAFPGAVTSIKLSSRRSLSRRTLGENTELVLLDHHLDFARALDAFRPFAASTSALTAHIFADFTQRPEQIAAARAFTDAFDARFIVASRWMKAQVMRILPGADVRVVPFPVRDVFFETSLSPRQSEAPRWAYIGRIHPDKGLDQLLEHLLRSDERPTRFELLGWRSSNRYESWSPTLDDFRFRQGKLESLINALRLKPRRANSESELADAFERIDACVFPSIFKGEEFGYALAQALAAGKTCWITDWRGHADFSSCPGVMMLPVSAAGSIPQIAFSALWKPGRAALKPLQRDIRRWAYAHHSVAAVALKLKASIRRSRRS